MDYYSTTLTNTNWSASCSTACLGQKTISGTPEPQNRTSARLQTQESTRRAARSATVTAASGPLGHLRRRSAPVRPPDKGCRLSACIFFPTYLIWPTRLPGTQTPLCPSQQKHLPVLHPHLWFLRTLPLKFLDFKRRFLFILAHMIRQSH